MTNTFSYHKVEKNIAKIGPSTYRIRVGNLDGYASNRNEARTIKRKFKTKLGLA